MHKKNYVKQIKYSTEIQCYLAALDSEHQLFASALILPLSCGAFIVRRLTRRDLEDLHAVVEKLVMRLCGFNGRLMWDTEDIQACMSLKERLY